MLRQAMSRFFPVVFCFATVALAFYLYYLVVAKALSACQGVTVSQLVRAFV